MAALAILGFTWYGWGHWGYGVISDYSLDITDALRLFQGDVPYRDFIPTYGPLHMVLAAPFFYLGKWCFPTFWILTSLLIFLQMILLLRCGSKLLPPFWQFVLLALAISTMVFIPSNSKFIMGYSPSGFLATFLFTIVLVLLCHPIPSCKRWWMAGICMGLTIFTKIDLGFTSIALLITLVVIWHRETLLPTLCLVAGYVGTWIAGCGLLLLYGAQPSLLSGSTLECFGQAVLFSDINLSLRIKILLFLGGCLAVLLLLSTTRRQTLRLESLFRPWAVWILPVSILADSLRAMYNDPLKQMVLLNWYSIGVFTLIGAHVTAVILRKKSLRLFRSSKLVILTPLLVIAGMGILRVLGASWYPLNYFKPAVLILGILWAARQACHASDFSRRWITITMGLCLILSLHSAAKGCRPQPGSLEWIQTPFGAVGFTLGSRQYKTYTQLIDRLQEFPDKNMLLCTYEPSLHLLSGMRSPALYTFFSRLGSSGDYMEEREILTLQLIQKAPPDYIVQDLEAGLVHKRFGVAFGREIENYIRKNYIFAAEFNGKTLLRKKTLSND